MKITIELEQLIKCFSEELLFEAFNELCSRANDKKLKDLESRIMGFRAFYSTKVNPND